jgi:microcystin synthetase protein McyG
VAAVNGPNQTVVSGEVEAVAELVEVFRSNGVFAKKLHAANAFHSSLVEPILDEFENFCGQIRFSEPRIPLISNLYGCESAEQMATANYWRRQARETVCFQEGMRSLASLGANIYLEASPQPIFASTHSLLSADKLWTHSLREGYDDTPEMLRGLSQLYVRGVDIDWRGVYRHRTRRKVSLPTYPFQRESFWLDNEPSTASHLAPDRPTLAAKEAGPAPMGTQLFYQLSWRPRSRLHQALPSRLRPGLPSPREIAEQVSVESDRLQAQGLLARYGDLQRELNALCSGYVVRALAELGWRTQPGAKFRTETLANELGISTRYRRLLARMLRFLEEDGLLRGTDRKSGSCWQVVKPCDKPPDVAQAGEYLARKYDECRAEIRLLNRCGGELANVLSGQTQALELLFPDGSLDLISAIYRDSPFARTSNNLMAEVVSRVMEARPPNKPLKILEIGGGTGGASAEIISKLSATPAEYVFTDISDRFTSAARRRFGANPYVRYAMLDIERSPAEQGFAAEQFDLIIAANVVHATRDLHQTLLHIRDLAAPGGLIMLLEVMKAARWLDLTFGLTDGWWQFTDTQIRSDHPLVGAETWTALLGSCGFLDTQVLPDCDEVREQAQAPQAVVLSRKAVASPATDPLETAEHRPSAQGTWIVLADSTGVAEQLVRRLEAGGGRCVTASVGTEFKGLGNRQFLVAPSRPESMKQFLAAALEGPRTDCRGVIHLWSLDTATADGLDSEEIHRAECLTCESVRQLLQGLAAGDQLVAGLWLVTRGAQPVEDEQALPGLIQAPLWGMGRAITHEFPTMRTALIDLDPQLRPDELAIVLETEILNPDAESQTAFRGSQRYAPRLCEGTGAENRIASPPHHLPRSTRTLPIKTDATYLITGGAGDLGLLVAEWLIKKGARHLVLTGRRDFPQRTGRQQSTLDVQRLQPVLATIEDLEATGARVLATRCDVADRHQIDDLLLKLFTDGWPALRGVVHAAGVVSPCGLLDLGRNQLTEMLRPKVLGTWNLHRALIEHQLDFFVMFSSGASLIGSPLLGSYAAANAFLDAIAHHRRATGHSSLTINWGIWENLGMVRRLSQGTGNPLVPRGMFSFTAEQGLGALESLLATDEVQTAVMPADWSMWNQYHPHSAYSPLLAELTSIDLNPDGLARSDSTGIAARAALLSMEPAERVRKIAELVIDQLSQSLRLPANRIDLNQSLNDMGIDSLMAVEMRNRLVDQLGIDIPIGQLLSDPSVNEFVEIVARNLASNLAPVPELPVKTDLETHGEDTAMSSR